MHYKTNVRPKYGLNIRILSTFLTKKELKNLIDRYMKAKLLLVLEESQVEL